MRSDYHCNLWPNREKFFRNHVIKPLIQSGLTCMSTALGSITGKGPAVHESFAFSFQDLQLDRTGAFWEVL